MNTPSFLKHGSANPFFIALAMFVVYVVWGSTFVGIAFVVEEIPPFTVTGFRFVLAGILLAFIILISRGIKSLFPSFRQCRNAALTGILLVGLASPLIAVSEQYIDSGLVALIVSITPVIVVLIRVIIGERPNWKTWLGVGFGTFGVLILIDPEGQAGWYALIAVLNPVIWSIGSFIVKAVETPKDSMTTAAWQTFVGGWFAVLFGVLMGEQTSLMFKAEKTSTWIAFFYISIMAALAYSAYAYLLANAPISLVATHAFVNPIVAVLLGVWLRNEQINLSILVGGFVVVIGVALVVLGEKPRDLLEPEL
jgi:drug/metabolite transporter (DMT)-like permease